MEKNFKPAIAYDCIYPMYAIDDPQLMTKLSPKQTRYVSIDAVNHVIEAATSAVASPYSISLAKQVIELVAKNTCQKQSLILTIWKQDIS